MRKLLAVGICAALALAGCGGGGDSDSAPSALTASGATQETAPQPSHEGATAQKKAEAKQPEGSTAKGPDKSGGFSPQSASTVKVPPISSAPIEGSKAPAPGVKTVKGGDNSVQTYGTEADEAARTEAAIALQGYLHARLQEDWGRACVYLAQRPKEQLEKLAKSAQEQSKDLNGCAGVMAVLGEGTPESQLREGATIAEVLSFRGGGDVPGDPSYLIFTGPPGKTLYSMPMYMEGGGWKVGLALPSELPL